VFLPCRLLKTNDQLTATPLRWTGSSDLRGLAGASGLVAMPAGASYKAGDTAEVVVRTDPEVS
jgi:molybdopterin biosynthesis enzyme